MHAQPNALGLDAHIMACWAEAADYDAIILLEDDTLVAPGFIHQALAAIEAFGADPSCAAIALHHFVRNETDLQAAFLPLSYRGWFRMQYPSSRGEVLTHQQWRRFQAWRPSEYARQGQADPRLPPRVAAWPLANWERPFLQYILDQQAYVAFPARATVTMFGELGDHVRYQADYHAFHSRLDMETHAAPGPKADELKYMPFYDPYFELHPDYFKRFNPRLEAFDFDVDLYGLKPGAAITQPYLLSRKFCSHPLHQFTGSMLPHEAGPILDVYGEELSLGKAHDFSTLPRARPTWKQRIRKWISS